MSPSPPGLTSVTHDDVENPATISHQQLSTLAIHADDNLNRTADVSPALHVSTTFRYAANPDELRPARDVDVSGPISSSYQL